MNINTDLLIDLVDRFLAPFGCDSDIDSDFCYDYEENRVYFSIIVSERADRLFREYVEKTFNCSAPEIFMLSLLHEVGHAYTLSKFSRFERWYYTIRKNSIQRRFNRDLSDRTYSKYFDLTIEKIATKWAVNYYNRHRKRCDNFYKIFMKTLHEEYKRLGVTE